MSFKNVVFFESLDSTNIEAWRQIKESNFTEETVIWTDNQKAGKGAGYNTWESEAKNNIAVSYILKPDFLKVDQQFYLNKCVSLAVRDCIYELCNSKYDVFVKWPNDILIKNKKIAGILIENAIIGDKYSAAVCGIGININQEKFPSHLSNATSVKTIMDKTISLKKCLKTLSTHIYHWYTILKQKDFETIDNTYLDNLYLINTISKFEAADISFHGKIKGVSEYGNLKVESESGEIKEYGFKEVIFPK